MSDTFKIAVLWTAWTPKVATRIVRDLMSLQRVAKQTRTTLIVACDSELYPQLNVLGLQNIDTFLEPDLVRVYVAEGEHVDDATSDRMPECPDTDVVLVSPVGHQAPLTVDRDPYAGVVFHKDWKTIPETMPLTKNPPKGNPEPTFSPFL